MSRLKKSPHLFFIAALAALTLCSCAESKRDTVRMQWTSMGTVAAVQCPTQEEAERAKAVCERVFREQELIFSAWREDSVISRVNSAAGGDVPVPVPDHFRIVLKMALEMHKQSGGAFNPLLAPLSRLWGFLGAEPVEQEPTQAEIAAAQKLADCTAIKLGEAGCLLQKKGMSLDLGGIVKGYAVDLAYEELHKCGLEVFLIDLGGNIRVCGNPHPGTEGWIVGVRDPKARARLGAKFTLFSGEAVATSGSYERFREINGRRYGHIVDAGSGRPAPGRACTIKADTAMCADALSTAVFILDDKRAEALVEKYRASWIY